MKFMRYNSPDVVLLVILIFKVKLQVKIFKKLPCKMIAYK